MGKQAKEQETGEFGMFREEFEKYQRMFGLLGYRVFFESGPFGDDFAGIKIELEGMSASVKLNSKLPAWEKPFKDVKRHAKHEALHLLIGRLYELGKTRCVSGSDLYEAAEELVHKLEVLLPQADDG